MRRVVRKRIRHRDDGFDLIADFNADVAINVGRTRTAASTRDGAHHDAKPVTSSARRADAEARDDEGHEPEGNRS